MANTIKQIIQEFCYRQNLAAPSTIVGVTEPNERQLLSLFKFIGDNLRNRPYQWPQLKRTYVITTTDGESKYQLPGDFYRLLLDTQWDATNEWPLRGPITDGMLSGRQFAVVGLQTRKVYRIVGPTNHLFSTSPYSQRSAGVFEVDPAADSDTDELSLSYLSCNWIWPQDWVASTAYTAGNIRSGDGYVYRAATSATSGSTRPSHSTGSASDGAVSWAVYHEPYTADATNSNLNDSDLCLFDDDLMIEGMRWAWLRAAGHDYQQERVDWEDMVRNAYARFNGIQRGNMADGPELDDSDWPLTAQGGWDV